MLYYNHPYLPFGRSFLLAILLLSAGHAHAGDDSPRILHRIVIHGLERTDEHVIRRELLFAEGDVLDSTLVAETARNLRRLLFIGEVHIRLLDRPEGVEVTVSVEDLYSRTLSPLISGQIDELSFGALALDFNFPCSANRPCDACTRGAS